MRDPRRPFKPSNRFQTKKYSIGGLSTSKKEILDLFKAWIAISIAFAVILRGNLNFLTAFVVSMVTVGAGFLGHELAHKAVAQHYNHFAEFRAYNLMLLLAIVFSFLGFVFAAPGAVMISGNVLKKQNGHISLAGPLTNFAFAILFLILNITTPSLGLVWTYGFQINVWLGLFNMIPVWMLDGKKIFAWNKKIWAVTLAFGIALMFIY